MAATVAIVRALVGDDGDTEIKNDAHYTTIIGLETNEYKAAALAARTLAAHFAQKVATSIGDVKIENQQKSEAYRQLATEYDKQAAQGGGAADPNGLGTPALTGVSIDDMQTQREDSDRYHSAFTRGMHDYEATCPVCGCCPCGCECS